MTLQKPDQELIARYILQGAANLETARQSLVALGESEPSALVGKGDELYALAKTINPDLP
ncbi:MAG TPA: hypothetical protein VKQ30_26340 [Ktedonobacterales bacterium]|nr:hypothetical protein [Ktedonobacterales bacterium]